MDNKFKSFLNESIYDVNILKELNLGKLKEEIFTEAKITAFNKTSTGVEIFGSASGGVAFKAKGKSGPSPSPAPSSSPGKSVGSISEAEAKTLIESISREIIEKPQDFSMVIGSSPVEGEIEIKNALLRGLYGKKAASAIAKTIISATKGIILLRYLINKTKFVKNSNLGKNETEIKNYIKDKVLSSVSLHDKGKNLINSYYSISGNNIDLKGHFGLSYKTSEIFIVDTIEKNIEAKIKSSGYTI